MEKRAFSARVVMNARVFALFTRQARWEFHFLDGPYGWYTIYLVCSLWTPFLRVKFKRPCESPGFDHNKNNMEIGMVFLK
jgi:hypothetical protein